MQDGPPMGELEFATPKVAWGGEAAAFTPRLAERLSYLSEACGLGPLELTGTEVPTGARRMDVLAAAEQRSVVIENQYGTADHDHLTRGLAYAVAQQAAALVVVAERHTDEFVAVADYLNHLAGLAPAEDPAVSVWLVEVQAVRRVGDTIWSPLFTVRTRPNQWEQAVRRSTAHHSINDPDAVIAASASPLVAQWIVDTWREEAHAAVAVGGDASATVQLRHPDPADPRRGHAHITVLERRVWVNVTYILDSSGAFGEEGSRAGFERRLRDAFPSAAARHRTKLPAYFAVEYAEIDERRAEFASFVGWLCDELDAAMGEAGEALP